MYDFSEMELSIAYTQMVKVLLGSARTFTANRLSFALDLHGPSYTSQGGAGAIFHLIEIARSQLEERTIDAAIVVSGNFLLTARSLAILDGMGLAAKDGKCRPFDKKANGYALSESCVAFFLQRESDARRNWATVVGADHKFFGQKQGSILAFDGRPAKEMLRQLYSRCQVDPASVCYIEADGSGVKERDVDEVDIISDVFCQRRKEPILIGSIKSNMGHAECTACAAGAVKAIVALNSCKIPPTIHVESPIPELTSKGLKIVTETTPFKGDFVGVNAIGLGGHFGHLLLKMNPK
ncbi:unnamed protein product [Bemisia tabaci]|uniref:Ketosynthase family 3 (KS3) domain-containing protein n=1 Tax=Bemisia tabaci TaxID=7038 RepID=A0A9P0CHT9_BEMTA|nr:unnamed protein product [Bemisia tabaci]